MTPADGQLLKAGTMATLTGPRHVHKITFTAGLRASGPEMFTVQGETQWAVCDALCGLVLRDD